MGHTSQSQPHLVPRGRPHLATLPPSCLPTHPPGLSRWTPSPPFSHKGLVLHRKVPHLGHSATSHCPVLSPPVSCPLVRMCSYCPRDHKNSAMCIWHEPRASGIRCKGNQHARPMLVSPAMTVRPGPATEHLPRCPIPCPGVQGPGLILLNSNAVQQVSHGVLMADAGFGSGLTSTSPSGFQGLGKGLRFTLSPTWHQRGLVSPVPAEAPQVLAGCQPPPLPTFQLLPWLCLTLLVFGFSPPSSEFWVISASPSPQPWSCSFHTHTGHPGPGVWTRWLAPRG